jgi:hypothetical protein
MTSAIAVGDTQCVSAETPGVPTYCLVKRTGMRITRCQHVFALQNSQEGWQEGPLLERDCDLKHTGCVWLGQSGAQPTRLYYTAAAWPCRAGAKHSGAATRSLAADEPAHRSVEQR